ncbi:response regulator transcription factor [Paenibacillus sacheonensis]|uniref:Response regulator n=1 Tax=Paenibacillus sacheonensis TaxID=742054 RepID=A0A7X5C1L1_9BACL|nr:response regulator [Paenibacillus sacheonensis]MBM7565535.1 two-component system response regulator YesN [Paenibacillus sacheonensis]NBC69544.1 response regulator [Paenibacillus sacheonensis]
MMLHRMLIVDDEPYIVNSLRMLFEEAEQLKLDLYTATSAAEALDWLGKTRIDIVLSDIRMPGMSGLELQERIREQWPSCKVIFLSGHNEFGYVQAAIQNGSAGYLLKTDDEEDIIRTVEKAVRELASERSMNSFIDQAKEQMRKALPVLQRDFLAAMAEGEPTSEAIRARRFGELELKLSASRPVMLVVGRVDRWGENYSSVDKELLLYAVQNIAVEVLSHSAAMATAVIDRTRFMWLLQPDREDRAEDATWVRFVQESLDFIQDRCKTLLHVPLSLGATVQPFEWEELSAKHAHLSRLLIRGLGEGDEMLLYEINGNAEDEGDAADSRRETTAHQRQVKLNQLRTLLESGQSVPFAELFDSLFAEAPGLQYEELQEIYYSAATMILSQINRWSAYERIAGRLPLNRLFALDAHASWPEAGRYLRGLADALTVLLAEDSSERSNEVVEKLHRYIHDHIAGDLSLVRLADEAELNSSYLCRLYKQLTGIGLSDYITDAKLALAKQLLGETTLKVSEVAVRIGFDSGYFSRFFKKSTTMTPQKYRENVTK